MSKDILLFVNEDSHVFDHEPSPQELFSHLDITNTKGIALAVNDSVVPKLQWNSYQFKDQDRVLIINATQGG